MTNILEIRAATVPLSSPIANALINFSEMNGSVVAVVAEREGRRVAGFGFGSIGRYSQTAMILERFAPRLLAAAPEGYNDAEGLPDPLRCAAILRRNEKPGGHGERSVALGAIDMALWDLVGRLRAEPLARVVADRFASAPADREVEVYAAGGYYHAGDDRDGLRRELAGYLDLGFESVKIKIGGAPLAADLARIETAVACVGEPSRVAVDANGRFQREAALEVAGALRGLGLRWLEEAGDPLDFALQAEVVARYEGAVATGENLFSVQDTINLLAFGGMRPVRDFLQMDPGLSYGVPEFLKMLEAMRARGWSSRRSVPHGGNLFNLHLAAGLHLHGTEAYPGVFAPFGGFGEAVTIARGRATLPEAPGIGWETKPDLMRVFRERLGADDFARPG